METIDQMLAKAALEESNLRLGFRSDALVKFQEAQSSEQSPSHVDDAEDDDGIDMDVIEAVVWGKQ